MTAFQWKPHAGDILAILFGACPAHSHAIEESLRPPLVGQLMDVLLERAYPNDVDRNQRLIETRLSGHTGSKDLTFDWVWQGLVRPPEAVDGGQSGEIVPSYRSIQQAANRNPSSKKAIRPVAQVPLGQMRKAPFSAVPDHS